MKLSFTLDEKIFNDISPEKLIEKAINKGVSSLELGPDVEVLSLETYKNIINIMSSNNLEANYHVPYFANEIYELEHFTLYENKLKDRYTSFLNLLEVFQEDLSNKPVIVIHGSDYTEDEKPQAMNNTLRFLDWMLNNITKRNLPFTLAIETLRKKEVRNTLDNKEDIFFILDSFKSDHLKICWDMCHDKLNSFPKETVVNKMFLDNVVYGHIHGHNLKDDVSHTSLVKNDLDYIKQLELLKANGFKGTMNIELLSNFSKSTYLEDLFNDIEYMKRFI